MEIRTVNKPSSSFSSSAVVAGASSAPVQERERESGPAPQPSSILQQPQETWTQGKRLTSPPKPAFHRTLSHVHVGPFSVEILIISGDVIATPRPLFLCRIGRLSLSSLSLSLPSSHVCGGGFGAELSIQLRWGKRLSLNSPPYLYLRAREKERRREGVRGKIIPHRAFLWERVPAHPP